ncbi:MAG: hypothetical protein AAF741_11760 [Bacteroidota bacterium]
MFFVQGVVFHQAVIAGEFIAQFHTRYARHLGAYYCLPVMRVQLAYCQLATIPVDKIRRSSNYAETTVVISHRKWNDLFDQRVARIEKGFDFFDGEIACGRIELVHAAHDHLKRTSLGTQNQVNTRQIAVEILVELLL